MKVAILSLMMVFRPISALAGVGQGNPTKTFFNMKDDYKISQRDTWNVQVLDQSHVRVDIEKEYRRFGFYIISHSSSAGADKGLVCAKAKLQNDLWITWLGGDCSNSYLQKSFEQVKESIGYIKFH